MPRIAELVQQVVNMPGTSIENNGQVILAGIIPGTKPVQYRYEFFKPLTDEEIKSVSDSSRRPFPKQLAQLYKITNGANLFGRFIRINGIPAWGADYKQPCSLIFEDGHRTVLCPKSRLFFASYYTQPQIQVFFDTKEPEDAMRVYAARYGSNKIIAEWPSLEEWLYSEHQKYLDKLQNGDYQLVDVVEGSLTDITFNVD